MDEGSAFALSLDRKLHSDLLLIALCPTQDLVICCFSDQVTCYRLNWQKVWTHQYTETASLPSAIAWHPEATFIAIGFADGTLQILETERGETEARTPGTDQIASLSWLEEASGVHQGMTSFAITQKLSEPDFAHWITLCVEYE